MSDYIVIVGFGSLWSTGSMGLESDDKQHEEEEEDCMQLFIFVLLLCKLEGIGCNSVMLCLSRRSWDAEA